MRSWNVQAAPASHQHRTGNSRRPGALSASGRARRFERMPREAQPFKCLQEAQMSPADVAISFLSHLQAKLYEIATRDLEQNHEADRYGPEPKRALGSDMQNYQSKLLAMARLKNSKTLPLVLLDTYQLLQDKLYQGRPAGVVASTRDRARPRQDLPKLAKILARTEPGTEPANQPPAREKKIRNMNFELELAFDLKEIGYDLDCFPLPIGTDATFLKKHTSTAAGSRRSQQRPGMS